MPSTLTQRRSGSASAPSATSNKTTNATPPRQSSAMPPRNNLSSIDKMTQPSEAGSVIKIVIWGVIILATGIGLAVIVRNLTQQNTEESPATETPTEQEEIVVEEPEVTVEEEVEEEVPEEVDTTETEEPTEEETTEETTATGEYSKADQTINENLTGNTVTISGYSYSTTAANFMYDIKLSNAATYPKVTATLDETAKTLTVKVYNLASDNIVGNGGSGSTTFVAPRNVQTAAISNSSNVTTFVFSMNTAAQYKLVKTTNDAGVTVVRIDIKNS